MFRTTPTAVLGAGFLAAIAACEPAPEVAQHESELLSFQAEDDLSKRWFGQAEFISRAPFWDFFPMRTLEAASTDAGPSRDVERADVYSHDEDAGLLYVLNAYRGLQVVDVSDPAAPSLIGRTALNGWPVEMYQNGDHAFVLLNSLVEPGQAQGDNWNGAVLRVFDLSNKTAPAFVKDFQIAGSIAGSRLLRADDGSSSIIYVSSNVYSWQAGQGGQESTFIMSIDVTNPAAPTEVETLSFDSSNRQTHVTPEAMFLASYDWKDDETSIQYVDISDFGGDIEIRGDIELAGSLAWGERGELQMNHEGNHLRVASQVRGDFFNGTPSFIRISTIDTTKPSHMAVSGTLDVGEGHRLLAARFSGDKAYLFHMVRVDPLEVIDLSDPAKPASMGILKIDGWVNHIEVRGDKLVTIGVNDVDDRKLALILFDVSDPTNAVELDRATAGEKWAWTSANHDLRAFSLLDELGVAMLPVSSSSWTEEDGYQFRSWIQLFSLDLEAGTVEARAEIDNAGGYKRAIPVDDHILTLGDQALKSLSLTNLDAPTVVADVELAYNVVDFATVGAVGVSVVAKSENHGQTVEMRVVPLAAPDSGVTLATVDLDMPQGRLEKLDEQHLLYMASDHVAGETILTVVNFSDPFAPVVLSETRVAKLGYFGWQNGFGPSPGPDTVLVGDTLAMFTWPDFNEEGGAKLRIISFEDRAYPQQTAVVELGAGTIVGMNVEGDALYVSSYEPVPVDEEGFEEGEVLASTDVLSPEVSRASLLPGGLVGPMFRRSNTQHSLRIVDLSDAEAPSVSDAISVPGKYVGQTQLGTGYFAATLIYTMDSFSGEEDTAQNAFDILLLVGTEKARLLDAFPLPQGVDNVFVDGNRALYSETPQFFHLGLPDVAPSVALKGIDLSVPFAMEALPEHPTAVAGWARLLDVRDGLAFFSSSYNLTVLDLDAEVGTGVLASVPTFGWWGQSMHIGSTGQLYLPAGFYGLYSIDL